MGHKENKDAKKITRLFDEFGIIGNIKEYTPSEDMVLMVQLPRTTDQLSDVYLENIRNRMRKYIPENTGIIFIGSDVQMAEVFSMDITAMKLQGIL